MSYSSPLPASFLECFQPFAIEYSVIVLSATLCEFLLKLLKYLRNNYLMLLRLVREEIRIVLYILVLWLYRKAIICTVSYPHTKFLGDDFLDTLIKKFDGVFWVGRGLKSCLG